MRGLEKMERSSKKQQELLQYIDDFIKEHGYGPSYREVMRGLGYKSVSTVAIHVNGLLAKGYIRKKDNSARSIEIVTMNTASVPAVEKSTTEQDHLVWIEHKIERYIKEGKKAEAEILIQAAVLLGSVREGELRAKL